MIEEQKKNKAPHDIILKDRKNMVMSGITNVESFDENEVVAYTELGSLSIKGKNLHINKINVDNGNLILDGEIDSITYNNIQINQNSGFFSKLFR